MQELFFSLRKQMQWLKFNQKGSMLAKNREDKRQYERISL